MSAGRGRARFETLLRYLTAPEAPSLAIEVRPRALGLVRVSRAGPRAALQSAAALDLPDRCLSVSMGEPNVLEPEAFRRTLQALLERAGAGSGGRAALVLPDPVARVALLPGEELPAKRRSELDEMIRFKLRRSIPFDIREAHIAHLRAGSSPEAPVLVAVILRSVLEGYEAALRACGLEPGRVELAGLALLGASSRRKVPGDTLLVNWDDGYVSLILARDEWPVLVRTIAGTHAGDPAEVVREATNTALYYRERLEGAGLSQALVRCTVRAPQEAAELLAEPLGIQPTVWDAGGSWAGAGTAAAAQALAGAMACLAQEAA